MKLTTLTLASVAALSLAACAAETGDTAATDEMAGEDMMAAEESAPGTIVEVAQGDESFSTLVEAVTAADLVTALSGEGPFTVFAPTNDAFAKLPDGTVEQLTTEDTEKLASILQYHVVDGNVDAATLTAAIEEAGEEGYTVTTLGGGTFTATIVDGSVMLTDAAGNMATVTATDVQASNGVVHVIDTVLMPE